MRYVLITLGIGVAIALSQGWFAAGYDHATTMMLSDEARLAIEVRCGTQTGRPAVECRAMLKKLFLSGALEPDRSLRAYCAEVKHSPWGGGHPPAPEICVQRYGGWRAS